MRHNFYPRSPCGERPFYPPVEPIEVGISIHALLAESDVSPDTSSTQCRLFLSTLSLRRATHNGRVNLFRFEHFYPRSPCGERRSADCNYRSAHPISIHALLAESDVVKMSIKFFNTDFYPRSPCGERRYTAKMIVSQVRISIHALLAESDHGS